MAKIVEGKTGTSDSDEERSTTKGTLIFISHDSRDAQLAEAFSKLLSSVSAGVLKSFRSSDRKGSQGIEYGVEWYPELMLKLESASDVVCLLTQHSLDRPWILYEAGVAKGKLNTPVYGIALGIPLNRANTGPFAQFQNSDDKEESLTKLVIQLLQRIPDAEPDRDAVQMQVKTFKERVSTVLEQIGEGVQDLEAPVDETSVAKLFEEIKVMFQDLPSRIEGRLVEGVAPIRRRKFRRFHPMMFEEMAEMLSDDPEDPIGILEIASLLRDDIPWLYDIGMEAYKQAKSGDAKATLDAIEKFRHAVKLSTKGHFMEEFGFSSKEMHMMLRELPRLLEHMTHRYERRLEKRVNTDETKKK